MGRAVRQFEKEDSFKLGIEVENVTSNCMGHAVCQLETEASFKLGKGLGYACYGELYRRRRPPVRNKKVLE